MVNEEKIKSNYMLLIRLLENNATSDPAASKFLNYLRKYKGTFTDANKQELKQFIIGANRFSDEFAFSNGYDGKIRALLKTIYEDLK